MKKLLTLLFSILILPLSVIASDVYYCSEDGVTGFDREKKLQITNFQEIRFKIMIDFENESVISNDILFFEKLKTKCIFHDDNNALYCINNIGMVFSINKTNLFFVRSTMFNKREGNQDSLLISHGTCEKF